MNRQDAKLAKKSKAFPIAVPKIPELILYVDLGVLGALAVSSLLSV
jgi:hypothetical protein